MLSIANGSETVAFFALAGGFEILERLRPAREVDRWKHLKIDVVSFALAILMNRISQHSITGFLNAHAPAAVRGGWSALRGLPGPIRIFLAVMLADFVIYWIHRAQHGFSPLWQTHQWHHSTEQLYWFSGFRVSFLHTFIYNIPEAAVPILVFNLSPLEVSVAYSIALLIQFWEHTNLNIDIGPLRYLFITPAYHRVHHSVGHNRRNFGATFSLWDRVFGTYRDPGKVPAGTPLGLGEPYNTKQMARMLVGF
jgi:sterol desaturase/sphingolipid hydroxylase (fatty acid hydroxylase superfamily)